MHHGFGDPDNWRNSRALQQSSGFFHGEHELHGMAHFLAGRVGALARVRRFQLPVRQPDTVCLPRLAMRAAGSKPSQLESFMPVITQPTPGNPGDLPSLPAFTAFSHIIRSRIALAPPKIDPLARQQAIENALSAALWHVRHGSGPLSIQAATGRAIRAASMLKQACADLTTCGVTA